MEFGSSLKDQDYLTLGIETWQVSEYLIIVGILNTLFEFELFDCTIINPTKETFSE